MERRGRLGAAGEHLVEVERLAERLDDARPQRVLAHPLDRRRELAGEGVHPLADLEQPCGRAAAPRRGGRGARSPPRRPRRRAPRPRRGVRGRRCSSGCPQPTPAAVRASSSATSWFLPALLGDAAAACPARLRSDSARVARPELGEAARHRHGRLDAAERRRRHLELEPPIEQLRLLAGRLGQDQEELVCAARVPEGGVAAADRRANPLAELGQDGVADLERVRRLLIAPKSSRSIWIRQSGRPCRRAALISRGSASSKALALPRPVRSRSRRAPGPRGSGTRSAPPAPPGARSLVSSVDRLGVEGVREPRVDGERARRPSGTTSPDRRRVGAGRRPRTRARRRTALPSGGPSSPRPGALGDEARGPRSRPCRSGGGR